MFDNTIDKKVFLSTLWIVVMFNMIFADFYSAFLLMSEQAVPDIPGDVRTIMLIAVFTTNIPIAMIFLSRFLRPGLNKWANIIAGLLTIVYVVGAGDTNPHYIAAAGIEVLILLVIIWSAWRWRESPA